MRQNPVADTERIAVLDVLRGFALAGVLLSNMVWWFSGSTSLHPEAAAALPTAAIDGVARHLTWFFVHGKFITIFSVLFGAGFGIQLSRAQARGQLGGPLFLCRMIWLLCIGAAHMLLLWYGDILHLYAVLGVLLLLWQRRSNRALFIWGVSFTVFAPLVLKGMLQALPLLSSGSLDPAAIFAARWDVVADMRGAYDNGSYRDVVSVNVAELRAWVLTDAAWIVAGTTFGKFLLGFLAVRSGLLARIANVADDALDRSIRRILLPGAFGAMLLHVLVFAADRLPAHWSVGESWFAFMAVELLHAVGVPAMAFVYICTLVTLFRRPAWRRRLSVLAPVGRMALTNYIGQSVICVLIFYGWGLGLYGDVGVAACWLLTAVVFSGQVLASRWWLRRYRFGPAEWAWRSLTYGRLQPLRPMLTEPV